MRRRSRPPQASLGFYFGGKLALFHVFLLSPVYIWVTAQVFFVVFCISAGNAPVSPQQFDCTVTILRLRKEMRTGVEEWWCLDGGREDRVLKQSSGERQR